MSYLVTSSPACATENLNKTNKQTPQTSGRIGVNPSTEEAKASYLCEFKGSLIYSVNSLSISQGYVGRPSHYSLSMTKEPGAGEMAPQLSKDCSC